MRHLCLGMFVWAVMLAGGARAQETANPLVGTWSYSSQRSDGSASHVYFFRFGPDGAFEQQLDTNVGISHSVGHYQLSPDGGTLQLVYEDYNPKQDCNFGFCYPLPPPASPLAVPIHFNGSTEFEMMDASGPMLWVRNN